MNTTFPTGRRLILATDLDDTLVSGAPADRNRLEAYLAGLEGSMLIYATGRSVGATRALMGEVDLPAPEVLIADVGTTVMDGQYFTPIVEVEQEIDRIWPGREAVIARLAEVQGIEEQEVWAPHRVSYWLREGTIDEALERARAALEGLPVEMVGSANTYIDVLPAGVNKGTTLRRVIRWLGREDGDVVVAGSTMNDLALMEAGFAGVVVGNAEDALRERCRDLPRTVCATAEGPAGILEGLADLGWVVPAPNAAATDPAP